MTYAWWESIEEQEDENEVWFPTEDHDEYEPASKPDGVLELLQLTIITTPT